MHSLRTLDAATLKAVTGFAHRVQRHTGLTSLFLAKCCGAFVAGSFALDAIVDVLQTAAQRQSLPVGAMANHAMVFAWAVYIFIIVPGREERELMRRPDVLPRRYLTAREPTAWRPVLLIFAAAWVIQWIVLAKPAWNVFIATGPTWLVLALYLLGVPPLPPAPVKENGVRRELLSSSA